MTECKRLTIFEGSDGAGKTTAAEAFAESAAARYVRFGPMAHIKEGLAMVYVEAMLPVLLGYQDVVFDRSWLSEIPYGTVFRNGEDRLGDTKRLLLEELAFQCSTMVVNCRPPYGVVANCFNSRRDDEMLDGENQLRMVYDLYGGLLKTDLPQVHFDYSSSECILELLDLVDDDRTKSNPSPHLTENHSQLIKEILK